MSWGRGWGRGRGWGGGFWKPHVSVAQRKAKGKFAVVGEFLSYDPYGIMFRKGDGQLAELVLRAFHDLAQDGEIERQYKRWFLKKLPSGTSLDLPMSPQLAVLIEAMAKKPE